MKIYPEKEKKKINGSYLINKKFIFSTAFIGYTSLIILLNTLIITKRINYKWLISITPITSSVQIRNSPFFQFFKYKFNPNITFNIIKGLKTKVNPISLDINFNSMQKLLKKRKEALLKGVLISSTNDFVNGKLTYKEKSYPIDIRLKGDWNDHLSSDRWSFRIKIKGEDTFKGLRKFSLHQPITRNYLWEWIFHEFLKKDGLPALRYEFKPLILNGKNLGIYALEEHFDKVLIESNKFREGPILKLDESILWGKRSNVIKNDLKISDTDSYYQSIPIPFKSKQTIRNKTLFENAKLGIALLTNFQNNKLTTSEVFDIDYLAKYLAISDLTSATHSTIWHNQRFYFDPVQTKLIPIGFDGTPTGKQIQELSIHKNIIDNRIPYFQDRRLTFKYLEELQKISNKEYLDKFINNIKDELNINQNILYKSFPALYTDLNVLYQNQKFIKNFLNPITPINSFFISNNNNILNIEIGNNQLIPIYIEGIKIKNKIYELDNKVKYLPGRRKNQFVVYKKFQIKHKKNVINNEDIKILFKLSGSTKIREEDLNQFARTDIKTIQEGTYFKNSNLINKKFISYQKNNKLLILKEGNHIIKEPLIIPSSHKFIINKNTNINFIERGSIISYSPIFLYGEEEKKITIKGEKNSSNQSIIVINSEESSYINNTIFENLSSLNNNRWILPGAITFYRSPVEIKNTVFKNNNSEDSLNLIKSSFILNKNKFYNSLSDALDIDFSEGNINNLNIFDSGNDGLDISGSNVNADNLKIFESSDKAISLGEETNFESNQIIINNTKVGIAVKDGSKAKLKNLRITNSEYGIAGYIKKNEYEDSQLEAINTSFQNTGTNLLFSKSANIQINNKIFNPNSSNSAIYKLIYK